MSSRQRIQKLRRGPCLRFFIKWLLFRLAFELGIIFAQLFQLFGRMHNHKNSHSHNHGAYSPAGKRYHCFPEKRRSALAVKLGYHGGFQREHGNKRRRQVNGARRRHGRALALAVPDNIYYRHNGNIEGVNRQT